jgi:nitroreductase
METPVIVTIKDRRSIRNYTKQKIPADLVETIINAGKYAPSAENRQPWKFIVISDLKKLQSLSQQVKKRIAHVLKHKWKWKFRYPELTDQRIIFFLREISQSENDTIFHNAPVLVLVVTTDQAFNDESCACAAQNMMLAAWSLGIGSCWIGFIKFLEADPKILSKLGIPEDYHISASLTFGYPEKIPKASFRKPTATIIRHIEA